MNFTKAPHGSRDPSAANDSKLNLQQYSNLNLECAETSTIRTDSRGPAYNRFGDETENGERTE